jgi:hypothetical protein
MTTPQNDVMFRGQLYEIARYAATDGTVEGAALAKRWKRAFLEYANLSARYLVHAKEMAKLKVEPAELLERFDALDEAFDELYDRCRPIFTDIIAYAEKLKVRHG